MERNELIEDLEQRLARWDRELVSLERRLAQAEPAQREAYRQEIHTLRKERLQAEDRLVELRTRDAEAWVQDDAGEGLLKIFDDIGARIEHLSSRAP